MKKVIITGATGFVGANLTRRMINDGHEVHLLVRTNHKDWRIKDLYPHLHIHVIDLLDFNTLQTLVQKIAPDWIFHLAVHGAYSYQNDTLQIINTNILSTIHLLEACLKVGFEAFINTGSSSEYGFKDHAAFEEDWLEPNSYYAVSKASSTLYCRYSAQKHKMPIYTLRLFNVYGPYEEPTRLIPTLITKGLNNSLPPLVDPNIARDLIYIDDVVDAYVLTAKTPQQAYGTVYNVGTGIQTSMKEIVDVAKSVLQLTVEPQWSTMQNRIWDTQMWVSNIEKIEHHLKWKPRYTFEDGFKTTVDWFKQAKDIHTYYYATKETT